MATQKTGEDGEMTFVWNALDEFINAFNAEEGLGEKVASAFRQHIIGEPVPATDLKFKYDFQNFWDTIFTLSKDYFNDSTRQLVQSRIREDYQNAPEMHRVAVGYFFYHAVHLTKHPALLALDREIQPVVTHSTIII